VRTEQADVTTRATVERYIAALNEADPDAIAACVTEDFFNEHTSAFGTSSRGRATYRARLPEFLSDFTSLHYDTEDLVVEGDRAAVIYRMSCNWLDGEGNGHPVTLRGAFYFRVANGGVAHRIDYWDGLEFTRQVKGSFDEIRN
jgi:ketosteroid isomerase-like protein